MNEKLKLVNDFHTTIENLKIKQSQLSEEELDNAIDVNI